VIILPNGPIANGNITNFTKAENRRIDFVFHITYGDSYEQAKAILEDFIKQEERILSDPKPFIGLGAMTTTSIEIHTRVWTRTEDYNAVFYNLNEQIYNAFSKAGLEFHHEK
jgi:small conductance mechanosensitive channel